MACHFMSPSKLSAFFMSGSCSSASVDVGKGRAIAINESAEDVKKAFYRAYGEQIRVKSFCVQVESSTFAKDNNLFR